MWITHRLDVVVPSDHDCTVRALRDLEVLVVDCQATGASPAFGHVLEMGWGVVRASEGAAPRAEAHWIALPEGHVVPAEVRRLTGWQPTAAAEAIPDGEAWRRLRDAVAHVGAPVPTAIHYARFELSFLRAWWARFEPDCPFPFDPVCLHAIAHRLYPELPRLSLRALAGYLGHGLALERRALGHVEATAFVWKRICSDLETACDVRTWEALQAWLAVRPAVRARSPERRYPIDSQRFRSLPDQPGVYRFLRRNGDVLYVGKAASLKKRTASHFIGRASKLLVPEMLTQVSDIAVTVTPSVLEAALLENETIKALNPPYNVQLRSGDGRVWYSDADFARAASTPSEAQHLGPLSSEFALRPLGALVDLLAGEAPTLPVRAHAVGVSALWPPDEAVFAAGWERLLMRHAEALGPSSEAPRWRALRLARALLAAAVAASGTAVDGREADETTDPTTGRAWDPERVTRHLERAAAQAYRAYRRGPWLRLVHDCDVVYREPGATCPRTLRIRAGEIAPHGEDARAGADGDDRGTTPPIEHHAVGTSVTGPPSFDRARYDRLRILTTELKRILRDHGGVRVVTRTGHRLDAPRLRGIFGVI